MSVFKQLFTFFKARCSINKKFQNFWKNEVKKAPQIPLSKLNLKAQNINVIDAPQSGLKGFSQTLNKTIKMRYDAQV
jgi:hypothetical protein